MPISDLSLVATLKVTNRGVQWSGVHVDCTPQLRACAVCNINWGPRGKGSFCAGCGLHAPVNLQFPPRNCAAATAVTARPAVRVTRRAFGLAEARALPSPASMHAKVPYA